MDLRSLCIISLILLGGIVGKFLGNGKVIKVAS